MSVLVNTCIFHEMTLLEHLFFEQCFAIPLLFLIEIYECIDNWALTHAQLSTLLGFEWTHSFDKGNSNTQLSI